MKMENKVKQQDVSRRIPMELFVKLIIARGAMSGQFYEPVFDAFIIHDMTGDPFKLEDDEFNSQLHEHNQAIHQELANGGIDVKKAFDINRKQVEFIAGGTIGGVDVDQIIRAIWADLNKLLALFDDNSKIKADIMNFRAFMVKGGEKQQELTAEQVKTFYTKLNTQYSNQKNDTKQISQMSALMKKLDAESKRMAPEEVKIDPNLKASFGEFLGHLKRDNTLINASFDLKQTGNSDTLTRKKKFRIQVWDKNSPSTFNLGTEVGCCLAPDGMQFPAMVQRRMDDSMFMHVVIDEETQKTVSLAWLYFGRGKNPESGETNSDIYVVANFFEIAASLGREPSYRDTIVDALKEYIGEYARDIGAKGLLLNSLTYGLIPDFKGYEVKHIAVDKVGGFFYMGDSSDPYYLNSLAASDFYEFKPAAPKIEASSSTTAPLRYSVSTQAPEQASEQPKVSDKQKLQ